MKNFIAVMGIIGCGLMLTFSNGCNNDDNSSDTDQMNDPQGDSDTTSPAWCTGEAYTLTDCDFSHGDMQNAIEMSIDDSCSEVRLICPKGGKIIYKIEVDEMVVTEFNLHWLGDYYFGLYLYDSEGEIYDSQEVNNLEYKYAAFMRSVMMAGTYYLQVYSSFLNDSSEGLPFQLDIDMDEVCKSDIDCATDSYCEYITVMQAMYFTGRCISYEPPSQAAFGIEDGNGAADTYCAANAIDVTSVEGLSFQIADDDVDVFYFDASEASGLDFTTILYDGVDIDMIVVDAATEPLWMYGYGNPTRNIDYEYAPAGRYYIYVGDFGSHNFDISEPPEGTYSVQVVQRIEEKCDSDTDCESLNTYRPTCVIDESDLAFMYQGDIGACVNYTPIVLSEMGEFCDTYDDCAGYVAGAKSNPTCKDTEVDTSYHTISDNYCTMPCGLGGQTSDCSQYGDYHCNYVTSLCEKN